MKILHLIVLLVAVHLALINPLRADEDDSPARDLPELNKTETPKWNETEAWVIQQVNEGKIADLGEHFKFDQTKRILRAQFIEDLLTGAAPGARPRGFGISITGATIVGDINLKNAHFNFDTWLVKCRLLGKTTFYHAKFDKNFGLAGSEFNQDANFSSMTVAGGLEFSRSVFYGSVDFSSVNIDGDFVANRAQFKDSSFICMTAKGVSFNNAIFNEGVSFEGANISGGFSASDASFLDKRFGAVFGGFKVGGFANFSGASFHGPVNFTLGKIGGQFLADAANFFSEDQPSTFNDIAIGSGGIFRRANFMGPVSFASIDVKYFVADGARFQSKSGIVRFDAIKSGGDYSFKGCDFAGPISFAGSVFTSLEVIGSTKPDSHFIPRFSVSQVLVKNGLHLRNLRIRDLDAFGIRVDGPAILASLQVDDSAALVLGEFTYLDLEDSRWPTKESQRFALDGTHYKHIVVSGDLDGLSLIQLAEQARYLSAVYTNLEAFFTNTGRRDLGNQVFIAGKIRERKEYLYPGPRRTPFVIIWLGSWFSILVFSISTIPNSISTRNVSIDAHRQLANKTLLFKFRFIIDTLLISFYNKVSFLNASLNRWWVWLAALSMLVVGLGLGAQWRLFPWLSSLLLSGFVGYGRHPEWAAFYCALIVGFGCLVFEKSKMERQESNGGARQVYGRGKSVRVYNRFWYSLELFLPFVKLQSEEAWKPKSQFRFLRNYMRIHTLLGWILIPIALVAVTGSLK